MIPVKSESTPDNCKREAYKADETCFIRNVGSACHFYNSDKDADEIDFCHAPFLEVRVPSEQTGQLFREYFPGNPQGNKEQKTQFCQRDNDSGQ